MNDDLIARQDKPRRTAVVLAMAMLSLSALSGCERRPPQPEVASPTPAPMPPSTQTTPSPMPPASAASR